MLVLENGLQIFKPHGSGEFLNFENRNGSLSLEFTEKRQPYLFQYEPYGIHTFFKINCCSEFYIHLFDARASMHIGKSASCDSGRYSKANQRNRLFTSNVQAFPVFIANNLLYRSHGCLGLPDVMPNQRRMFQLYLLQRRKRLPSVSSINLSLVRLRIHGE